MRAQHDREAEPRRTLSDHCRIACLSPKRSGVLMNRVYYALAAATASLLAADYDEAARVKRYDVARDSGMMPPTVTE
jgi:hypothetical protein